MQVIELNLFDQTRSRFIPSTDIVVIPDEGTQDHPKRINLEWIIIKPQDAFHTSYRGDLITDALKEKVLKAIEYFLNA